LGRVAVVLAGTGTGIGTAVGVDIWWDSWGGGWYSASSSVCDQERDRRDTLLSAVL
jgi:hypothetical protein